MKFKVKVQSYTTKEIDVEFPLFLRGGDMFDSGGWYESYHRIEQSGIEYKIVVNNRDEWQYEKKLDTQDLRESLGYYLVESSDYSKIEAKEFNEKLEELKRILGEVPT